MSCRQSKRSVYSIIIIVVSNAQVISNDKYRFILLDTNKTDFMRYLNINNSVLYHLQLLTIRNRVSVSKIIKRNVFNSNNNQNMIYNP